MNKRRMESLAKFIENLPEGKLKMGDWIEPNGEYPENGVYCKTQLLQPDCGTTCCIAGWAVIKAGKCLSEYGDVTEKNGTSAGERLPVFARNYLELNDDEETNLFYGDRWPEGFGGWGATNQQAAARIRRMIKTGE